MVVGGPLAGGEGLREEDGALGVIARGVVDEGDREELGVVVAGALELVDPLRPRDADYERLEAGVARRVLLVHRHHAEVLDPVAPVALGAEGLERAVEGGLGEAAVGPGEQVGAEHVYVFVLMGKAGLQRLGRLGDRGGQVAQLLRVVRGGVDGAVGGLGQAQLLDRRAQPGPGRVGGRRGGGGRRGAGEGGLGDPVDEVQPQLLVVELVDAVVAEEVGVGGDDDPSGAVLGDRRQRRAWDRGALVRPGDHPGAVRGVQGAGAVEAGAADAGERVGAGATVVAVEGGEDPGRGVVEVVLVVLERGVLDLEVEAAQELVQVGAVLVLLGLAEDDQAAALADEGLDRVDLGAVEERRAAVHGRLPLRVGRVGDHQHRGAGERVGAERAVGMRGDVERARGEQLRGAGERRVAGMGGLHLGGDLGPDGPRLGVGLVEEDAGRGRDDARVRLGRSHDLTVIKPRDRVNRDQSAFGRKKPTSCRGLYVYYVTPARERAQLIRFVPA